MKLFAKLFGFLLLTFLLLSSAAFAEPKSFVSEGKYGLGCLDSQKDAKSLALIDAKKQAIDGAVKYLAGLPDVKAAKLTGDQIHALATLMLSVEVLSEERKQTGEFSSITIKVRATLDSANIKDKIAKMREDDQTEHIKEMQTQLATLQKELDELKAKQQQQATPQQKEPPAKEHKEPAEIKVQEPIFVAVPKQEPQALQQKESAPMEVMDIMKSISNEEKQKYENVMKNIFALDALEKGYMALVDLRWNDAQYVFSKAIELNPELADAYTGMSCALHNLKQSLKALTFVNIALKINAQSVRSLGIKALILKDQPGKINQALASVNEAVKLKNDNAGLYRIRGEVYAKMGKTTLARKDFAAACNMGAKESCKKVK
jgi:tetratricopeptide (TPR) repeat protein